MDKTGWLGTATWHLDHYHGPLGTVVDVGAFTGEFSFRAVEKGARRVIAFEPNSTSFATLQANLLVDLSPNQNVEVWNLAVTADGRDIEISHNGPQSSGIIYQPRCEVAPCPSIPFVDAVRHHSPIDYLKIDIECGEYELFDEADEAVAKAMTGVRFLDLEIHKFDAYPGPRERMGRYFGLGDLGAMDALIALLQRLGFEDGPCAHRERHPGSFCSYNRNFEMRGAGVLGVGPSTMG